MMIDFGVAQHIEARATGHPGQRTFHLRILGEAGQSASLKLEKEHLLGVRMGLYELQAKTRHEGKLEAAGVVYFPPTPDYDFPAGQLGIGFSDEIIVLEVRQLEAEGDQDATVIRTHFTPEQGAALAAQIDEIIAAGRPICPLCKTPIDPEGHMCTKSNGHSQQPIPEEPSDNE
jgi:uncharacterized repeat protein (TIGR03847 family)